jgi:hypothetical protein
MIPTTIMARKAQCFLRQYNTCKERKCAGSISCSPLGTVTVDVGSTGVAYLPRRFEMNWKISSRPRRLDLRTKQYGRNRDATDMRVKQKQNRPGRKNRKGNAYPAHLLFSLSRYLNDAEPLGGHEICGRYAASFVTL